MVDSAEKALEQILGALDILSEEAFRFAGGMITHISAVAAVPPSPIPHPIPDDLLVRGIQGCLYNYCYAHPFPGPPTPSPYAPDPHLPFRLDGANQSRERWDGGWRVYQIDATGRIFVNKGDCQRSAWAGEYLIADDSGGLVQPGSIVTLRMPRGSHTLQPGFQFMYSESPTDIWNEHVLTRVYFNVTPDAVGGLIEFLTRTLNSYQVPYRMKALTDATHYTRTDSVVLYFAHRYVDMIARLLADMPTEAAQGLIDPAPLFTYRFRTGIGMAEDPGNGESFGMHRSRLVAEGAVDAYRSKAATREAQIAAIRSRFTANGLDLDRPYLGTGRRDIFEPLKAERLAS
jgi:hypothetical protein